MHSSRMHTTCFSGCLSYMYAPLPCTPPATHASLAMHAPLPPMPPAMHAPHHTHPLSCMSPAMHAPLPHMHLWCLPCMPPSPQMPHLPCMPPFAHPPWTEWLTHTSENITLPQTSFVRHWIYSFVQSDWRMLNKLITTKTFFFKSSLWQFIVKLS